MADGENKGQRLLGIFDRLSQGERISKEALAREYGVTEKSIQRDIDDIRSYLSGATQGPADIRYDRQEKGYRLVEESGLLTRKEILAMAKNPSRKPSLCQGRTLHHLDKLIDACPQSGRQEAAGCPVGHFLFHKKRKKSSAFTTGGRTEPKGSTP